MTRVPTEQEALDAFYARQNESERIVVAERRRISLALAGWSPKAVRDRKNGAVAAYEASLRPEGLDYPLTNKSGGRKRGQKPKPDPARFQPLPFE